MLEHIISKMVLDRACPICGGVKRYRTTSSARTESIECKNCNGKGYMQDTEPSILIVPFKNMVHSSVIETMKRQKMYVVDNTFDEATRGLRPMRIYAYNIDIGDSVLNYYTARKPNEIHMYFGQ